MKKITKECSEICYEYTMTNAFLYRGSHPYDSFDKIIPRMDRKPMNTNPEVSAMFDEEFEKLFGWKPRSEGVFCTGRNVRSELYGDPYIVFPKNGYQFIWSKRINDLYIDSGIYGYNMDKVEEVSKKIRSLVLSYRDHGMRKAIRSGVEVTIKCDYYYVIERKDLELVKKELGI